MLDRLNPKKIIIVSSAPQIRYPDCYGIDMAKLDQFIAFKACIELHKEKGTYDSITKKSTTNVLKDLKKIYLRKKIMLKISISHFLIKKFLEKLQLF